MVKLYAVPTTSWARYPRAMYCTCAYWPAENGGIDYMAETSGAGKGRLLKV